MDKEQQQQFEVQIIAFNINLNFHTLIVVNMQMSVLKHYINLAFFSTFFKNILFP